MAFVVALPHAGEPSPSRASLNGLDGINFFNAAMLAGFGPYVAAYLAEQKWTQENIGFVLTASDALPAASFRAFCNSPRSLGSTATCASRLGTNE